MTRARHAASLFCLMAALPWALPHQPHAWLHELALVASGYYWARYTEDGVNRLTAWSTQRIRAMRERRAG